MKKTITGVMSLLLCFCLHAQTHYYTQDAIISGGGSRSAGDKTGQFITFSGRSCYDSDKNGHTVGNGFLEYLGQQDGYHVYCGDSYWGGAYYYFNADRSRLNIRLIPDGKTIVYQRTAPPSSATTCHHIWPKSGGDSSVPVPYPDNYVPDNRSPQRQSMLVRVTCEYCKGTGTDPLPDAHSGTDYSGTAPEEYCRICRQVRRRHFHGTCVQCRGKGYIEKRQY